MISLAQAAYEQIRQRVASGELTPAKPLSETFLAQELRMSRTPVREAIRRLESEGILQQRPKQGTFVRAPSRREMRELFELRILLEPLAAARAARRRRPAVIRRLEETVVQMTRVLEQLEVANTPEEVTALFRRFRACDRAFHETLVAQSGNRRVCKVINDAGILALGMGFPKCPPTGRLEGNRISNREHGEIVHAIRQGRPRDAARAIRRHLVDGLGHANGYFDWLKEQSAGAPSASAPAGDGAPSIGSPAEPLIVQGQEGNADASR